MNSAIETSYEKLRQVNVNDKIEKKNGLSYLSWAFAVDTLLQHDPEAIWEYPEPKQWGDTWMVFCAVTAFGRTRRAQLPVMDHRNKAIPNPDAFAVNTAMQRCLAKAIALHGLGLYIYAGEDLPADANGNGQDHLSEKQVADLQALVTEVNADRTKFLAFFKVARLEDIPPTQLHSAIGMLEAKRARQ